MSHDRRPHVICWTCASLGAAGLPRHGAERLTPHLAALAAAGCAAEQCFAASPVPAQARVAMLTGRYAHAGEPGPVTLASRLAAAGYQTHCLGVPEPSDGPMADHEHHWPEAGRAQAAGELAAKLLAAATDQPLHLAIWSAEISRPWPTADELAEPAALPVPPDWPDTPEVRAELAGFERQLQALDAGVGRLLAAIEAQGQADQVLFCLTTAAGPPFARRQGTLFDGGLRTTLLIRWDGRVPAGQRVRTLLSQVDLLPTILDLLGLAREPGLDGRSFAEHLTRRTGAPHRQWIFAAKDSADEVCPGRCVRTERWKYIRHLKPGGGEPLPERFDASSGAVAREPSGGDRLPPLAEELYDIQEDPHELRNLRDEPGLRSTVDDLAQILDDWLADTDG